MPVALLLVLFLVVPIAELYVIIQIGETIGLIPTILLLIADSVVGTMLLRSQGRAAWRRFSEAIAAGRIPQREIQDGVAVIFGGAFLITPGFLTDIVGVLLLLPPTRALIVRLTGRWFSRQMMGRVTVRRGPGFDPRGGARRPRDGDIEGTATEYPSDPSGSPRLPS